MPAELLTLATPSQQLQLAPHTGGALVQWVWNTPLGAVPLLAGAAETPACDPFELGGFALLPWCNRITQGGFAHQGNHYAVAENREGEPYPIHGDGWLHAWQVQSHSASQAVLSLQSRHRGGHPWDYDAQQTISLTGEGITLALKVTHRGRLPLLYGLGWSLAFPFDEESRLQASADGVWLSGPDPIPIAHSSSFPPGWDFRLPAPLASDQALDNCFTGWDGEMRLSRPRQHLMLVLSMQENSGYYVLRHAAGASQFHFEPVTHAIDAFHAKSRPGLVSLAHGESLQRELSLRVERMDEGLPPPPA